ncbi:MAG: hypothetical protein DRQ43_09830, partial [Gammaproteobacteria bacterium]
MIKNPVMTKEITKKLEKAMKFFISGARPKAVFLLLTILLSLILSPSLLMAQAQQTIFASAEAAADKLYEIVETMDRASVAAVFG